MKMIAGAASLACLKRSRTREAPMPTIASTNSDALIGEERRLGLPRHRAGEQRLARARATGEQHAARDPPAEPLVLLRVAQEVDDLGELGLGLVDAGDVLERDLLLPALDAPRARAAEVAQRAHRPARRRRGGPGTRTARSSRITGPEAEDQAGEEAAALVDRLGLDDHALVLEQLVEVVAGEGERRDLRVEVLRGLRVLVRELLLEDPVDGLPLRRDALDVARPHLLEERRAVGDPHRLGAAGREDRDEEVVRRQQAEDRGTATASAGA